MGAGRTIRRFFRSSGEKWLGQGSSSGDGEKWVDLGAILLVE